MCEPFYITLHVDTHAPSSEDGPPFLEGGCRSRTVVMAEDSPHITMQLIITSSRSLCSLADMSVL